MHTDAKLDGRDVGITQVLICKEGFPVRVDNIAFLRVLKGNIEELHRGFGIFFGDSLDAFIYFLLDNLAEIQCQPPLV